MSVWIPMEPSRPAEEPTIPIDPEAVPRDTSAAEPAVFLVGETVAGRYRIDRPLGRGGMGQVFAAEDLEVGGSVALKVIRPLIADRPNALALLRREVQLARRVTHRNVCRIFDLTGVETASGWGRGGGLRFLTMELLGGRSLAEWLAAEGPFDPELASCILRQVALGLDAAHAAGVVHGDLKPANVVWVEDERRAVVTDFGLARSLDVPGDGRATGATPIYAAPEVLAGDPASRKSDLFSFGALAGALLVGRPLNRSEQVALPEPWQTVVTACLQADPAARPASAMQALGALGARPEAGPDVPDRRPGSSSGPSWRRPKTAAFGLVALCLAGAGFWLLDRPGRAPGPASANELVRPSHARSLEVQKRPILAVLGPTAGRGAGDDAVDDEALTPSWSAAAVADALRLELAAAQQIRVLPAASTEQLVRDLGLGADAAFDDPDVWRSLEVHSDVRYAVLTRPLVVDVPRQVAFELRLVETSTGRIAGRTRVAGSLARLGDLAADGARQLAVGLGPEIEIAVADTGLPADPEGRRLYTRGLAHLRALRLAEAEQVLNRARDLAPDSPRVHEARAAVLARRGAARDALRAAERAFELAGSVVPEQRSLIEARYRELARQWPEAEAIYQSLVTIFPDHLDYRLGLASVRSRDGRPQEALETLEAAGAGGVDPADLPRLRLAESEIALYRGHFARALDAARAAAEAGRDRRNATLELAARRVEVGALDFLGRRREATAVLTRVTELARRLDDSLVLAQATLGRLEATQETPATLDLPMSLDQALAVFRQTGSVEEEVRAELIETASLADSDEAERAIRASLAKARAIGHREAEAAAYNYLALVAASEGRLQDAVAASESALRLSIQDGGLVEAWFALQRLAADVAVLGRYADYRPRIRAAMDIERHTGRHRHLALLLMNMAAIEVRTGYPRQAVADLGEALDIVRDLDDPSLERWALRARGRALEIVDEPERAERDWRALAALNRGVPDDDRIDPWRARLARLDDRASRTPSAVEALERALDRLPIAWDARERRLGISIELAWAHLARGETERCRRILRRLDTAPAPRILDVAAAAKALEARTLAAEGQSETARRLLLALDADVAGVDLFRSLFARLSMAWVLRQSGDLDGAETLLREVEAEAEARGFAAFARQAAEARRLDPEGYRAVSERSGVTSPSRSPSEPDPRQEKR